MNGRRAGIRILRVLCGLKGSRCHSGAQVGTFEVRGQARQEAGVSPGFKIRPPGVCQAARGSRGSGFFERHLPDSLSPHHGSPFTPGSSFLNPGPPWVGRRHQALHSASGGVSACADRLPNNSVPALAWLCRAEALTATAGYTVCVCVLDGGPTCFSVLLHSRVSLPLSASSCARTHTHRKTSCDHCFSVSLCPYCTALNKLSCGCWSALPILLHGIVNSVLYIYVYATGMRK